MLTADEVAITEPIRLEVLYNARSSEEYEQLCEEPDLLIAATAERAGLVVLHYDEDYDRAAAVTGQGAEWIAPRGSVD